MLALAIFGTYYGVLLALALISAYMWGCETARFDAAKKVYLDAPQPGRHYDYYDGDRDDKQYFVHHLLREDSDLMLPFSVKGVILVVMPILGPILICTVFSCYCLFKFLIRSGERYGCKGPTK